MRCIRPMNIEQRDQGARSHSIMSDDDLTGDAVGRTPLNQHQLTSSHGEIEQHHFNQSDLVVVDASTEESEIGM